MASDNTGLNSIEQNFLRTNDIFGLEFDSGFVFLQVKDWSEIQYDPYTDIGTIDPQRASQFQRLEDEGDDILHVEKSDGEVLHAGIGHKPAEVRRYTNYPEGENRLRTIPNLSVPRASSGDDYGYVDGEDSPYDVPTEAEELVIPPGRHIDFAFYNPNQDEAKQPVLNIRMRKYNVEPIDPNRRTETARRVLSPGSPMPTYPVGGMNAKDSMGNLAREWDVSPVTRERIMGGGNR